MHLIDVARTVGLQANSEVAGVGFGHRCQAHLQTGTARGDGYLGDAVQNLIHVVEDAVGFG